MSDQIAEIKTLAETQSKLLDSTRELKSFMEKANGEISASKAVEAETKSALDKISTKAAELADKCLELERKLSAGSEENRGKQTNTVGEMLVKSDAFKSMQEGRSKFARIELKAAIVNATG